MKDNCKCEHVNHFGGIDTPGHEPLINYHDYNAIRDNVSSYRTIYGVYRLCKYCAEECQAGYILCLEGDKDKLFSVYQEGFENPIVSSMPLSACELYITEVMNSTHSPSSKLSIREVK